MKKLILSVLLSIITTSSVIFGQNSVVLTFTGIHDTSYFQPGSIKIKNLTQGGDTILYYPDTVLVLNYMGIDEELGLTSEFMVRQNYPNPVADRTSIDVYIPSDYKVTFTVTDIQGRNLIRTEKKLDQGMHSFRFTPGGEDIYFFSANWKGIVRTIKILNYSLESGSLCSLDYLGSIDETEKHLKSSDAVQELPFNPGDKLLFIGYADTLESGIVDSPENSHDYVFQFASNTPCPGVDSLFYEGRWYHTVQIFSQCWMKENLEAGTMISGIQTPSDNGIIEKYCYANQQVNCDKFGGLYLWEEAMQYTTTEGGRGICPEGWHMPSDEEWKILEGVGDSYYGIGHMIWNQYEFRGTDAALNLKAASGWSSGGNGTDLYGFAAMPAGYWWQNSFFDITNFGIFWTSSTDNTGLPNYRGMRMDFNKVARKINSFGATGYPVRCLKD